MTIAARLLRFALLVSFLAIGAMAQTQTPVTHADLDWTAPYRWVHIDNVNPQTAHVFELCRHNWLAALHKDGRFLGDGRALFFCAHGDSAQTYYTFYPWRTFADMDARGKMAKETQVAVGDSVVNAYDSGDSTLLPPHGSQMWRREPKSDIYCAGTDSLTDLTFAVGRMDHRVVDWMNWDLYAKAWDTVRAVLSANQYPLACRVYTNVYGGSQGDCFLLWLARNPEELENAPSMEAALTSAVGAEYAGQLVATLNRYFPIVESVEIERRPDMSNLGR